MPYYENLNPSMLERKAKLMLEKGDIVFVTEFSFPDLKSEKGIPLRFDFAIFEDLDALEREQPKFLLEMQGEQHYKQKFTDRKAFARQQANDKRKRNYCKAKGYHLVEIPYTDYNLITLDYLLELGKFFE